MHQTEHANHRVPAAESAPYLKHVSRIKHVILKGYLGAWANILGSRFAHLAYFDLFAGGGIYRDEFGQYLPGSPESAIRVASDFVAASTGRSVTLGFSERNAALARELEHRILGIPHPSSVKVRVFAADATELADEAIRWLREAGRVVPAFFFVDPFGYSIPVPTLRKLLALPKAEVLVNLMWYRINMDRRGMLSAERLTKLFGHDRWKSASLEAVNPQARQQAFLRYFEQEVGAPFHVAFPMPYSPQDQVPAPEKLTKYYLVHYSTNVKAPLVMKEVLFRARPKLDALKTSSTQLELNLDYRDPRLDELKSILTSKFRSCECTVLEIREKTVNTPYAMPEYRQVLRELDTEPEGRARIRRMVSKRDGLADGDLIIFK